MMTGKRRVAVTGIGLMTALGNTRDEVWAAMTAGQCGIRDITAIDGNGYRSRKVAELRAYPADRHVSPKAWRRFSRSDQTAIIASREALVDAGVLDSAVDPDRVGVFFGSGTGDLMRNEEWFDEMRRRGLRRAAPLKIFNTFSCTPCDVVASHFGFEGPKASVVSACSSSTVAIGYGSDLIAAGRADVALAGASDMLCRLTFSGFNALRLVDNEPCRPFCRTRNGMNLGEGAAVLVLEEWSRARRRGARIYAEILGYGVCCEAYHPTSPEPEGRAVARLIGNALRMAGVSPDRVDHINAHGTGTPQNDRAEARGIRLVWGDRAGRIPVTSVKSMVGHCLGAAGAVEAATLALSIAFGVVLPTLHHREADPDCDIDLVVHDAREVRIGCGLSTSLAFGGNNAALVMGRVS
jgi:3-oxoacyl-[acyl-carrier-protein] synthase II